MTAFGERLRPWPRTVPSRPMRKPTRPREVGRGERVLPGLWRLRLPLPWPGVPHCNAWAIAAGDGIVLVDTGTHEPGSLGHLERALDQVRLQARATCGSWSSPTRTPTTAARRTRSPTARAARCGRTRNHQHFSAYADDPEAAHAPPRRDRAPERRAEGPAAPRAARCAAGPLASRPRPRCPASTSRPTSAPGRCTRRPATRRRTSSCFQRERRLLISGDHLLGRVSLYFDYGYTPDPVGEFLELARHRRRRSARGSRCPATAARSPT